MKKDRPIWFITILLLVMVMLAGSLLRIQADAVNDEPPVDFVLVLDCSDSMPENDPEGLTKTAAQLFIDLLPTDIQRRVRISVVTFGVDYGADAVDLGRTPDKSTGCVKIAYDLQDISSFNARDDVKAVLDREVQTSGKVSPIGYALEAAAKLLVEKGSADGNAAIILLSDGQVYGQSDGYNANMDYDSIDQAVSIASSSNWPIYCMELNYRNENEKGSGLPGIAYYQMRENIPPKTGTDAIELKSPEDASREFLKIIEKFLYGIGETVTPKPPKNSDEIVFEDEMTGLIAEANVLFRGEKISAVNKIDVTSPEGKTVSFYTADESKTEDNIAYTSNAGYILLKMTLPANGTWIYDIHGKNIVENDQELIAFKVAFTELDLQLSATVESGELDPETTIRFDATYSYNGIKYENTDAYKTYPAKLYINDKALEMQADETGYTASFTFTDKGVYRIYARVDSDAFRKGYIKSNEYLYSLNKERKDTVPKGKIPDVTTEHNTTIDPIDVSQYYDSPDGDPLIYKVSYNKAYEIKHELTADGKLTLTAGQRAGSYEITVTAEDGSGEKPVEQKFNFIVEQKDIVFGPGVNPAQFENPEVITLRVPEKADAENPSEYLVKCSELFVDPDGCKPRIVILNDEAEGVVDYTYNPDTQDILFFAVAKGEGTTEIRAIDENDPTNIDIQLKAVYKFKVVDPVSPIVPIAAGAGGVGVLALAVLAFLFLGRNIYGTWDIYSRGAGSEMDRNLAATANGSKASCRLDSLLDEMGMDPGFGNVMLVAGNKLSKDVFLTGLDGMRVEVNGEPVEDPKILKKLAIRPGQEVIITSDYSSVTLQRTRI